MQYYADILLSQTFKSVKYKTGPLSPLGPFRNSARPTSEFILEADVSNGKPSSRVHLHSRTTVPVPRTLAGTVSVVSNRWRQIVKQICFK